MAMFTVPFVYVVLDIFWQKVLRKTEMLTITKQNPDCKTLGTLTGKKRKVFLFLNIQ